MRPPSGVADGELVEGAVDGVAAAGRTAGIAFGEF